MLGKPDEVIQRTIHCCASMDSIDAIVSDDSPPNKHKDNLIEIQSNYENQNHNDSRQISCDKKDQLEKSKLIDGNLSQTKSDSESGYDESCSNMSRSGIDECNSTLEADTLSHSASLDKLNLDQLKLELDSVAVDWRPFRNIYTCSCAIPFDHFTKKASFVSIYVCIQKLHGVHLSRSCGFSLVLQNEKKIISLVRSAPECEVVNPSCYVALCFVMHKSVKIVMHNL